MKALRFAVRALGELLPDDFGSEFDVVAHCDDGKIRHAESIHDTRAEAAAEAAGYAQHAPTDLNDWEVTRVSEAGTVQA